MRCRCRTLCPAHLPFFTSPPHDAIPYRSLPLQDQSYGPFPSTTSLFWYKSLNLVAATLQDLGEGESVQLYMEYEQYAGGPTRTAVLGRFDDQVCCAVPLCAKMPTLAGQADVRPVSSRCYRTWLTSQHMSLDLKDIKITSGERVIFHALSSYRGSQGAASHDEFRSVGPSAFPLALITSIR